MIQSAIEALLKNVMGLDTPSIGSPAIERAVAARMGRRGVTDQAAYLELIRKEEVELQELIESVVVPETWFFRHAESFEALERVAFSEWLPAHHLGLLRILSVPCSTGEEPYSIAMKLLEVGFPASRFNVEATDISGRVLAHAARGIYGKNSFRSQELGFRDKYFTPAEGGFGISRAVRDQVQFFQSNILTLDLQRYAMRYDIIFCRNLLIYFDRETQTQILAILKQITTSKATFFMGPAEALLMRQAGFYPTADPMAFAFQLGGRPTATQPASSPALPKPPAAKKGVSFPNISPPPQPAFSARTILLTPPSAAPTDSAALATIQELADSGQLERAHQLCLDYIRLNGDSAESHYLLGLIEDSRGNAAPAEASYRKALYLNPSHREAMLHWALLAEKKGDAATAQRLQARARRLAELAA